MEKGVKNYTDKSICLFFQSLKQAHTRFQLGVHTKNEFLSEMRTILEFHNTKIKTNTPPEEMQEIVNQIVEEYNFRFGDHYQPFKTWSDKELKELYETIKFSWIDGDVTRTYPESTRAATYDTFVYLKNKNVIKDYFLIPSIKYNKDNFSKEIGLQSLWRMLIPKFFSELEGRKIY